MSSSVEISTHLPAKPSFSQTCSRLSQYLKAKGSFGDLNLDMTCNTESNGSRQAATMNFFPVVDRPVGVSGRNLKSMDLFPQTPTPTHDVGKSADSSVNKTGNSENQMTIFYNGQVMVFNDFPAEKAKEIIGLACKGSSQNQIAFTSPPPPLPKTAPFPQTVVAPTPHTVPNFATQERRASSPKPSACELPIARRASLHRFLEKRKDRITAKAPYQTSGNNSKLAGKKSWLGLAAQTLQ